MMIGLLLRDGREPLAAREPEAPAAGALGGTGALLRRADDPWAALECPGAIADERSRLGSLVLLGVWLVLPAKDPGLAEWEERPVDLPAPPRGSPEVLLR